MGTLDCSQNVEQQLEEICTALIVMRNALFLVLGYRPNGAKLLRKGKCQIKSELLHLLPSIKLSNGFIDNIFRKNLADKYNIDII